MKIHEQVVKSPMAGVADALSCPYALGIWMADNAWSERRGDGRVVLWWNEGRQALGRWTVFDAPTSFSLAAKEEDGASWTAAFALAEEEGATRIEVQADGDAVDWSQALADLAVFVETGVDARQSRRPMMGIQFDILDATAAEKAGAAIDGGVLISSVVPGSGAEAAGLTAQDVLETVGGVPVTGWRELADSLRPYQAGDTVDVVYWRAGSRATASVTLQPREAREVETDPGAVAETAVADRKERCAALMDVFEGVDDDAASRRPAEEEWSAKEVLSHVVLSDRWSRGVLCADAFHAAAPDWPEGYDTLHRKWFGAMPLADALHRTVACLEETEALRTGVLANGPAPALVRHVAEDIDFGREHFDGHMAQAKEALGA